ncbi:rna-binding protein 39-like isoform 1 [Moniliophthora roreri]|nr:rna-binding protein 39-like isoform 1 [Moniliophthora roreri]
MTVSTFSPFPTSLSVTVGVTIPMSLSIPFSVSLRCPFSVTISITTSTSSTLMATPITMAISSFSTVARRGPIRPTSAVSKHLLLVTGRLVDFHFTPELESTLSPSEFGLVGLVTTYVH